MMKTSSLKTILSYGAPKKSTFLLDPQKSRSIHYLDLCKNEKFIDDGAYVDGVVEKDGRSAMYFLDTSNPALEPEKKAQIVKNAKAALACRAEKAVLAIIEPGQLRLYPCNRYISYDSKEVIKESDEKAAFFIHDLIEGYAQDPLNNYLYGTTGGKDPVHDLLFELLTKITQQLNKIACLRGEHQTILALIGRALLARFLLDRKIITKQTFPELYELGDPEQCFHSAKAAALVNQWMDKTFNGEFLPLPKPKEKYEEWFETLEDGVFNKLSAILYHAETSGQLSLPGFVNFAHIPVGLFSEVYERYAHENLNTDIREKAKKESIRYTPRHIAEYMLEQSFPAIKTSRPDCAKILDPACGAGVFVVLAFKKLIQKRWDKTKKRPDTRTIRDIMYQQLTGLDTNEAALSLTALGLYLSALELDPDPLPPSKLKFKHNLIGNVLHLMRGENEPWERTSTVIGSLGEGATDQFTGKYDLVIGNPPWSNFPKSMSQQLTKVVKDVAQRRDSNILSDVVARHHNPDQVPDLPFVWKSMEWAKKDAVIAFSLHARFLFKSSEKGSLSRQHLFQALNVTGILNASAVRQTKVWPNVRAQFCLLFARNTLPTKDNYFNFISPELDINLNNQLERMRIDYLNANPVQAQALVKKPYLLKTLYKGTPLDVDIIDRMVALPDDIKAMPLKKYWEKEVGKKRSGQGYKVAKKRRSTDKILNIKPLNLEKKDNLGYIISPDNLSEFTYEWLEYPGTATIYYTPLVLVNEAIGAKRETVSTRIAYKGRPIAYNESFYGYSTNGHPQSELLAEYLFILLNSKLFLYYVLMTSAKFAVEREAILKIDLDTFPILPIDTLSDKQKQSIGRIAKSFQNMPDWRSLDNMVYRLYGMNRYDRQVIQDSLDVALPIAQAKKRASAPPKPGEIDQFIDMLKKSLLPLSVFITTIENNMPRSWTGLRISKSKTDHASLINNNLYKAVNNSGSTRIIESDMDDKHINIYILSQYRYWTQSRARLLALEIINHHAAIFS